MSEVETTMAKVLIVDDDPVFKELAAACLGQAGCVVETAADGAEGLEALDRSRFDLVVIDLTVPRVDGLRMVALVRGTARHGKLAIMVSSTARNWVLFEEAVALGADDALMKPVDWSLFTGRVKNLVAAKSGLRARNARAS
jgi:DNA-binding response OmpR family regulator